MIVAVKSVVLFEVPDAPLDEVQWRFLEANKVGIGMTMVTVSGQPYVMRAIESLTVERRERTHGWRAGGGRPWTR